MSPLNITLVLLFYTMFCCGQPLSQIERQAIERQVLQEVHHFQDCIYILSDSSSSTAEKCWVEKEMSHLFANPNRNVIETCISKKSGNDNTLKVSGSHTIDQYARRITNLYPSEYLAEIKINRTKPAKFDTLIHTIRQDSFIVYATLFQVFNGWDLLASSNQNKTKSRQKNNVLEDYRDYTEKQVKAYVIFDSKNGIIQNVKLLEVRCEKVAPTAPGT